MLWTANKVGKVIMEKNIFSKITSKFYNKSLKLINTLSNDTDLKKLINNSEIVSFDIFDTVILRKVFKPADIFTIVENLYNDEHKKLEIDFKSIRSKAEPEATKILAQINSTQSIGLDEIYAHIQKTHNLDSKIINILKALEIEIELKFCVKNEYMYSFYQYCIDNGKKVIFTSDMYLPEYVIKKILHDNGYTKFYQLYLSSVIRKSKSKGGLYSHIINDLSCKPSKILHIGDYYYADVINAMKEGIKPYYYKKTSEYALSHNSFKRLRQLYPSKLSIEESIYFATIINKTFTQRNNNNENIWYDFGYVYCGIIYFGLTRWLTSQVIHQEIEHIFFLARDGYIMHKVYNLINQGVKTPVSKYMYASRRAINIPTIDNGIDEYSIKVLCHFVPNLSVVNYLDRVDIEAEKHIEKIKEVGFSDQNHTIETDSDKDKLAKLFYLLVDDVCSNAAIERENLLTYLDQIGFMGTKKVAIVDIGWQGTIQNSLNKLMLLENKEIDINGYYLGTFQTAMKFAKKGFPMSGYMCNFSKPKKNHQVLSKGVHMFEFIFSAPHGSVIKFDKKNNKAEPVFEPNDFSNGKLDTINEFQKGAMDFITDFMATERDYKTMNIAPETAIKPISRLLNSPTYSESVNFGNLKHSEYVGANSHESYFAKTSDPLKMFINPIKFKQAYSKSLWKAGFRKRYMRYLLPENLYCYFRKH